MQAMEYALDNLPLKDELLRSAGFTNFQGRENASLSQIQYIVKKLVLVSYFAYVNAKSNYCMFVIFPVSCSFAI